MTKEEKQKLLYALLIMLGILLVLGVLITVSIQTNKYCVETKITEEMYNYQEVLDRYDGDFTVIKMQRQNTYYAPHDELPPAHHFSIHIVTVLGFTEGMAIEEDWVVATYYRSVWHGLWNDEIIIDYDIVRLETS